MTNIKAQPIKIAILAMGRGKGGGVVLADWIVDMGRRRNGYVAQTTSGAGPVAQRTGADHLLRRAVPDRAKPEADGGPGRAGADAVAGAMSMWCLRSELMEAGPRGCSAGWLRVTAPRSSRRRTRVFLHRKKRGALGDGRVDSTQLLAHTAKAAQAFHPFRHGEGRGEASGKRDSARVLFGALAGFGPCCRSARAQFESDRRCARWRGRQGPASRPFGSGVSLAPQGGDDGEDATGTGSGPVNARSPVTRPVRALVRNACNINFPLAAHDFLLEGVRPPHRLPGPDLRPPLYLDRMARHRRVAKQRRPPPAARKPHATPRAVDVPTKTPPRVGCPQDPALPASSGVRGRGRACSRARCSRINEYMHPAPAGKSARRCRAAIGRWLMNSTLPKEDRRALHAARSA